MNSRYAYDENAQTWPIFVLAVASVAVVPFTAAQLYKTLSPAETTSKDNVNDAIEQKNVDSKVAAHRAKNKSRRLLTKKNVFLALGWVVIAWMVYLISVTEQTATPATAFDPYELLGVEFGTSEKDIKSHYRKLTIKFHPDKVKNASEEEKKDIEEKFVLITKAYKALTDEETKENYEKYGHPDGPQQVSHGIALPKFLVDGKSSPLLVALYIVLIGGVLPYVVGSWWNKAKNVTKRGIYSDTAEEFISKLMNHSPAIHLSMKTIMTWLSEAVEYKELLPGKTPAQIVSLYEEYLSRTASDDALVAVSIVPKLINGLIDITSNFRNTDVTLVATDTMKHFSQALIQSPKNELLQLPHVNRDAVIKSNVIRLGKLMTLSRDEMKTVLGIKDDALLDEALTVATHIPKLEVIAARFEIPGEDIVHPSSTVFLNVKVLVKSAKHHGARGSITADKLEEPQTMEAFQQPLKYCLDQPELPLAYAPYFPVERQSGYVAYVILQKDGKICDQPVLFKNLDLSNLELDQSEYKDGKKLTVGTFKLQMTQPTPGEAGEYQFRIVIKSLDYFTQDIDCTVVMNVQQPAEPAKIEEMDDDEDDIPLAKEGTLSGTLAQLKGEKVEMIDDEDEDEDESDWEKEEEFTDINTDTEDEAD